MKLRDPKTRPFKGDMLKLGRSTITILVADSFEVVLQRATKPKGYEIWALSYFRERMKKATVIASASPGSPEESPR